MKNTLITIIALASSMLLAPLASADVPPTLTYSGHLTDDDLPFDGTVDVVFELFSAQTGGTAAWSEAHNSVSVDNGLITVELGGTTDLTSVLTGQVYWLEVTVDGTPMLPRTPFNSVPYALKAATADAVGEMSGTDIQEALDTLIARIEALETENAAQKAELEAHQAELTANAAAIETNASTITTNATNITTNATNITTNATNITANTTNIETNTTAIAGNAAEIANNETAVAANATAIAENEAAITTNTGDIAANAAQTVANETAIDTNTTNLATAVGDIDDLENKTASMSVSGNEVYFTGVNVNVRSGSGSTNGSINGRGNLIVGYNEARGGTSVKTGSHNLVVGRHHNYSSYGGLVVGYKNSVGGPAAAVSGGYENTAAASHASVSGGSYNNALTDASTVSGGFNNAASGDTATVGGGNGNEATGDFSWVGGGYDNTASGSAAAVSGGSGNTAAASNSAISGGRDRSITSSSANSYDWRAGDLYEAD